MCAATRQTTPNLASFDPTLLPLCKQLEAQAFAPFGFGFTATQKLRISTSGISGGRSLTRPFRGARRFPSTRWYLVLTCTRTPRKFGICPSFKGHFLSPRAKPHQSDPQLWRRCTPVGPDGVSDASTRRDILDAGGPLTALVTLLGEGSTTAHAHPVVGLYASTAHRLLLSMDAAGRYVQPSCPAL